MIPFIIAGAIGYGIAKLFEEDKAPKYDDGGDLSELNNYLRNIRLDEYYMENEIMDDDDDIKQFKADFGRKGNIVFRIYPDKEGNVNNSIYISSIGRGTLDYGIVQGIEGKKDSRGEGAKAIASLFLLYPNVNSIHYEDESYFENEDKSFWKKIGGDSSELFRNDFFNYYQNKFGYNPDIRYAKGGLIAPNGKKSNLTALQYKLVRTKAFKDWFGDWENDPVNSSKIVDDNGEPLVVYHGTNAEFNTFKLGYGSYSSFTENKTLALSYGDIINQFFLVIKNPYIINGNGEYIWKVIDDKASPEEFFGGSVPFSNDGIMFKDVIDFNGALGSKYVLDVSNVYMVRKNNQIKLADGTNTTFDGNNPDIRYAGGGSVNVIDVKQYNVGGRNYRFVEIAEKNNNKIELYRQADDGNYYGHLLYRRVPRYDAEFSSPMVNDLNQLYAYEPVSQIDLFNAVKNRKKPFASIGYWLSYYTEEEIQKEIESFIDECHKYDLEYAVEDLMDEDGRLDRKQFQVCQKGTFDELFDIDALLGDYFKNDFDSYDVKKIIEFRDMELSYFLTNEWDDNYALTGLILGIPPKFTMGLLNMGTTYGLGKDYKYDNKVIIMNK